MSEERFLFQLYMYINAQKDKTIGNAYFCPLLSKKYTEKKCYMHVFTVWLFYKICWL